jgi:hypothetical protein
MFFHELSGGKKVHSIRLDPIYHQGELGAPLAILSYPTFTLSERI